MRVEYDENQYDPLPHSYSEWQDATSYDALPNHNGPVWLYCPDIGNEDEGYGTVLVGHRRIIGWEVEWEDTRGRLVHPAIWCAMRYPVIPDAMIGQTAEEAWQLAKRG